MTEVTIAPGSEPVVPATDTTPLNEHQAAEALTQWRTERDAPPKEAMRKLAD